MVKARRYLILWGLLFLLLLLGLNTLFMRPDADQKYELFFHSKEEFDVLFFGTSHVMDAVYPTVLYEETGLRSFNLGNPAETLEATYYTMKTAFAAHRPKAAVIDVAYIDKSQAESQNTYSLSHLFWDAVPLSPQKIKAVFSLFPADRRAEFLFPFVSYHTRWEELLMGTSAPISECKPYLLGAELRIGRSEPALFMRTAETDPTITVGKEALLSCIALCQENGVLPILLAIPYPADTQKQRIINSAADIAAQTGIPFLNLFDLPDLVDFNTDCYDPESHLNPDGAWKVSRFLGETLLSLELSPSAQSEESLANWANWDALYLQDWADQWQEYSLLEEVSL